MAGASKSIVVDVPRADFFEVIRDYERYPEFLTDMDSVRVVRRDGPVTDVEFTLNLIKRISYTLRLTEVVPSGLTWTLVEGMFKENEGGWVLDELDGGRTHATYSIEVKVGVFLPGAIVNRLLGQTLPDTLAAFKSRAEQLGGTE